MKLKNVIILWNYKGNEEKKAKSADEDGASLANDW